MSKKTIKTCLKAIGVESDLFEGAANLDEEFKRLKRVYFKNVLKAHPDKGGDPAAFRDIQTSWEVLRDLYDSKMVQTFAGSATGSATAERYDSVFSGFDGTDPQPYEYYEAAAEEAMPPYRVELARSNRSSCKATGAAKKCGGKYGGQPEEMSGPEETGGPPLIAKGEVRVGSLDNQSGGYGRWRHVPCWRVPSKIWLGVQDVAGDAAAVAQRLLEMNEVLFSGFSDLGPGDRAVIVAHVQDRDNWARLAKAKKKKKPGSSSSSSSSMSSSSASSVSALVSASFAVTAPSSSKQRFVAPLPGVNGTDPRALAGKTVVLTGVFPELGGGGGLDLGKARARALVESFGGRVTGSVSGKTDVLVVGQQPGFSKVSQARARGGQCRVATLHDLKIAIESPGGGGGGEGSAVDQALAAAPPVMIRSFSSGYHGNGNALLASDEALAVAAGLAPVPMQIDTAPKAKKKRKALAEVEVITCGESSAIHI